MPATEPADPAGPGVHDVLLVEDDPGSVLITREAFEVTQAPGTLHVVGDGELAMEFLHQAHEFTGAPRPSLILLDINLPRRSGLEVLAEVKSSDRLLTIPVVMLSTSQDETDILRSYQLHANAYIAKPASFDLFTEVIKQVTGLFLTVASLPPADPGPAGRR
jgi:CheY-like chemotaxis protein